MKSGEGLWIVIYMARGAAQADSVEAALSQEGFLVRRRLAGGHEPQSDGVFEIMVLRAEAKEAQAFLIDNGL